MTYAAREIHHEPMIESALASSVLLRPWPFAITAGAKKEMLISLPMTLHLFC
jgi:hypothetical protein